MNKFVTGMLCSFVVALTACGGGSSGSSGKKSSAPSSQASSSVVSSVVSSSVVSSSAASVESSSSSVIASSDSSSSVITSSSSVTESSSSTGGGGGVVSSAASSLAVSSSLSSLSVVSSSSFVSSSAVSSSASSVVAQTGVFIDSAVAGIAYTTTPGGFSGFTSAEGQYQYAEGDTVVFSIGDLVFPAVAAKGVVTPVDIAESADPVNAERIQVNIAALLQSLDTDGNPDNGISINYDTAASVAAAVDFNQSYSSFAALPAVTTLVANSGSTTTTLVSETAAAAHLAESLADVQAKALIGTWYVEGEIYGESYKYVLFILDEHRYASVDSDSEEVDGSAVATGNYVWDQVSGKVTLSNLTRTDSDLDARPPMAEGNTLVLDGNTLTIDDDGSYDGEPMTFELTRLMPTQSNPLIGGWSIEEGVVFAFTDTHYFMGQYTEPEDDDTGYPGMEMGTYTYDSSTKVITYATGVDTNGQWGLSHPCAIQNRDEIVNLDFEIKNYFACGAEGADIVQTFEVTGDTLTLISEADTIAYGEEEPVMFERVNGLPDGDTHLKLELTLTLTEYDQGDLFTTGGGTMQCDLNQVPELGETEVLLESWVIGGNSNRKSWISRDEATYDPVTKKLTLNMQDDWAPISGHPGFVGMWTDTVDLTYQPGQENVIVGTVTEVNNLSWDRNRAEVSTCTSIYSVVGKLRPVLE